MFNSTFDANVEKYDFYEKLKKFPPFYTIQDHDETRKKQLMYWAEITHHYFKQNKIQQTSISELQSEQFPLFQDNSSGIIKITLILEEMERLGNIQWANDQKQNFSVNWFSSFELADCIQKWAKNQKLSGDIETVKFIATGPQTEKSENQIVKALGVLEQNGNGTLMEFNGQFSFKFG